MRFSTTTIVSTELTREPPITSLKQRLTYTFLTTDGDILKRVLSSRVYACQLKKTIDCGFNRSMQQLPPISKDQLTD